MLFVVVSLEGVLRVSTMRHPPNVQKHYLKCLRAKSSLAIVFVTFCASTFSTSVDASCDILMTPGPDL